jgi:hypothetical protein
MLEEPGSFYGDVPGQIFSAFLQVLLAFLAGEKFSRESGLPVTIIDLRGCKTSEEKHPATASLLCENGFSVPVGHNKPPISIRQYFQVSAQLS